MSELRKRGGAMTRDMEINTDLERVPEPDLMARLERSLQPEGWRERVGCSCKPDDGAYDCPRMDECMEAWRHARRCKR